MVLLLGFILIAIPVSICAALTYVDQKRTAERYGCMVYYEGRLIHGGGGAKSRNRSNEMDQIVIDLQPDGYLVEDEHDYDDIDDNWNE
jgi:hypothetical protein